MKKILLILSLMITTLSPPIAQADVNPEIISRIKKNKILFSFLDPFLLHPNRAGTRDDYKIYYPKNYNEKDNWPLVVLLHGIYVSGKFQDHFMGLKNRVSSRGFVLLVPGSTYDQNGMRFWNSTAACCDFFESKVDDVAYLQNLIIKVKNENKIGTNKISVVGHSNGAMMAQRLACDTENLISKVVSYAGVMDGNFTCKNKGPLKLSLIHDENDDHILFNGMSDEELNYRLAHQKLYPLKGKYISAIENFKQWEKILPSGSVELKITQEKGHMPKLSHQDKNKLVDLLIQ